jgi:hypothetical protein
MKSSDTQKPFWAQVDLQSGSVKRFFQDGRVLLYDFGKAGYCYLKSRGKGRRTSSFEAGVFDPATGQLQPAGVLDEVLEGQWEMMTVDPSGSGFAVVVESKGQCVARILDEALLTVKDIQLPNRVMGTGGVIWVGSSLWIGALLRPEGKRSGEALGLCVLNTPDESSHLISLGPRDAPGEQFEGKESCIQPTASPDGTRVAVCGTWLVKRVKDRPIALVLFDTGDPRKAPQFVPLPEKASAPTSE